MLISWGTKGTRKSKGFAFVFYEDQRSTNIAVESCKHWLGREGQRTKMDMISLMAQRKNERIPGTVPQTDKMDGRRVGSQTDADDHDMRSKGHDRKHDEDDFEPKSRGDYDKKEDRWSRKHGNDGPRPREEKRSKRNVTVVIL